MPIHVPSSGGALDFLVRAGTVWLRGEVADLVAGEQLAQRAVVDVGEGVVGHQPLRGDAVLGEEGECALDEDGDGGAFLVDVEFDVGEPRQTVECANPVAPATKRGSQPVWRRQS